MFAVERQEKIKKLLDQNGRVTITELVALFDTSHETVRKDLVYLEQQNVLKRIYGGAVRVEPICDLQSLALRRTERVEQKMELLKSKEVARRVYPASNRTPRHPFSNLLRA